MQLVLQPLPKGKRVRITELPASIGRSEDSTIVIPDDVLASRKHCVVEMTAPGKVEVQDTGSHHGTYVNGERTSQTVLSSGDTLQVGATIFRVKVLSLPHFLSSLLSYTPTKTVSSV